MYHRSSTEAPLARATVPGGGDCAHCGLSIVGVAGFSGWYKEAKSGGLVHDECWDLFRDEQVPRCNHCNLPIRKARGFSGKYSRIRLEENGPKIKVHKECVDAFLEARK